MIKALFNELQKSSKKARVTHFKDDASIAINFEIENAYIKLYVENVKELLNHKTVAIVKIEGRYRPLYLCDIKLIRKSCIDEMYIYEASVQVNSCFSYDEIYTASEINKELSSYTIFRIE